MLLPWSTTFASDDSYACVYFFALFNAYGLFVCVYYIHCRVHSTRCIVVLFAFHNIPENYCCCDVHCALCSSAPSDQRVSLYVVRIRL